MVTAWLKRIINTGSFTAIDLAGSSVYVAGGFYPGNKLQVHLKGISKAYQRHVKGMSKASLKRIINTGSFTAIDPAGSSVYVAGVSTPGNRFTTIADQYPTNVKSIPKDQRFRLLLNTIMATTTKTIPQSIGPKPAVINSI